jgi:UDP-N-acetylmuramyl pentapeptide phosphotransferase/UDP-N-acetylglucosamine-1-phosphate transferase
MFATMAFALSGSLIGFLIYNYSPAKIFMGDTGSLLIGLLNSIFVIKFISIASDPKLSAQFFLESAPAIGFAVLIVPLFDTLRVFSVRIINRRSPFSPDRNHIHHFLLDLGLNHKMVTTVCVGVNILFIALAYALQSLGTTLVFLSLTVVAVAFVGIVYYRRPRPKLESVETISEDQIIKSHKILTLATERIEQD